MRNTNRNRAEGFEIPDRGNRSHRSTDQSNASIAINRRGAQPPGPGRPPTTPARMTSVPRVASGSRTSQGRCDISGRVFRFCSKERWIWPERRCETLCPTDFRVRGDPIRPFRPKRDLATSVDGVSIGSRSLNNAAAIPTRPFSMPDRGGSEIGANARIAAADSDLSAERMMRRERINRHRAFAANCVPHQLRLRRRRQPRKRKRNRSSRDWPTSTRSSQSPRAISGRSYESARRCAAAELLCETTPAAVGARHGPPLGPPTRSRSAASLQPVNPSREST